MRAMHAGQHGAPDSSRQFRGERSVRGSRTTVDRKAHASSERVSPPSTKASEVAADGSSPATGRRIDPRGSRRSPSRAMRADGPRRPPRNETGSGSPRRDDRPRSDTPAVPLSGDAAASPSDACAEVRLAGRRPDTSPVTVSRSLGECVFANPAPAANVSRRVGRYWRSAARSRPASAVVNSRWRANRSMSNVERMPRSHSFDRYADRIVGWMRVMKSLCWLSPDANRLLSCS